MTATDQMHLIAEPAESSTPALTARQQLVLEYVASAGGGYAVDIGGVAHSIAGPRGGRAHDLGEPCEFCAKTGRQIGDRLVDLGLVKRRRGEPGRGLLYVPLDAAAPGMNLDFAGPGELPEDF